MAVLSSAHVSRRLPLGDRILKSFRATTGSAAAANEWIRTGLSRIDAILGVNVIGQSAGAATGAPVAATATLDMTGDTPADANTVTIDGYVYTLKTTIGTAVRNVLVSGTPATQAAYLAAAINGTGTPGVDYTPDTYPHPNVKAAAAGDTVVLTYRVPGTVGNGAAASTDITGATLANFAGGTDGAESLTPSLVFRKNAQGTGAAEGANLGDLGVESSLATVTFEVTILGSA